MDDSVRTQENTGSIFRKRERIGNASQVPAEKPIVGSDKPEGFDNGPLCWEFTEGTKPPWT